MCWHTILFLYYDKISKIISHFPVNAKEGKCHEQSILKQGFTLKVKDEKARRLLTNARTIKECVALSCKYGGADYAVFENGRCHTLTCKKNACKITKDAKSTQKIASLSRRGKLKMNKKKKQNSKRKAKESKPSVIRKLLFTQLHTHTHTNKNTKNVIICKCVGARKTLLCAQS